MDQRRHGRQEGFTLIEILVVVSIIGLLFAIAAISLVRNRATGNEAVAIANLRQLAVSLQMYNTVNNVFPPTTTWKVSMYGAQCRAGFAPEPDFGPPAFCLQLLGNPTKDVVTGYVYEYAGDPGSGGPNYNLWANPQTLNVTGTRAFYMDETNAIRHCTSPGLANASSPTIDQPPVPCG